MAALIPVSHKSTPTVGKSAELKRRLEDELLSGQGWQVRIVESGCLDVCPVGGITVRLVGAENSEHKTLTWTCEPTTGLEDLIGELKKFIVKK